MVELNSQQFPQYEGTKPAAAPGRWMTHDLSSRNSEEARNEPGAKWGRNVALVPVGQLERYRELDRTGSHSFADSEKTISGIADDLRKGGVGAMREPLWLDYSHEAKWGYLSEGHHRLEAAKRAGITHVPVRIGTYASSAEARKKRGLGAPLHLDNRLNDGSYIPSELHPGNFQEFASAR